MLSKPHTGFFRRRKWLSFILVAVLVFSASGAKTKKRKTAGKIKTNVKKSRSSSDAPPVNCEMTSDGSWEGEGCEDFMNGDHSVVNKGVRKEALQNLDWVIHPMKRDEFFNTYYQKKPFVIERQKQIGGNTTDYYGDLFPMTALAKCIDSFPSQRLNDDFVVVKQGFRTPGHINRIHDSYGGYLEGHTLAAFIMNRLWSKLGALVDTLENDFGFPFRVNVYLTPRGSQGFFPHTDQHDFFIMQMAGEKIWKVFNNPTPLPTRAQELGKHGTPLDEKKLGKPSIEVLLKQGDVIYSPRGFIHSAKTMNHTGSMHLTVRILNAFFFKWGDFFSKALPDPTKAKTKLGLPPLKQLNELDLEFRYSTPLKWMDLKTKREQIQLLKKTLCTGETKRKTRSRCNLQDRWVDAFYRAKIKWKKQKKKRSKNSDDARKKDKENIRRWLENVLDVPQGAIQMRKLRQTIDDEHHNLLKQVNGMFPQGLKSAFGVNQLCLAKKVLTVTSQNEMSVDGKGVVGVGTDATRTLLTTSSGKSHTFRPELFDALKQVEEFSKAGRPFFVKQLTRAVDDFERIALAHHLHDLRILDAVEIQRKRV